MYYWSQATQLALGLVAKYFIHHSVLCCIYYSHIINAMKLRWALLIVSQLPI